MSLIKFDGKKVKIINTDGVLFSGIVSDYFYPEDNDNGIESIIIDTNDNKAIEFYPDEIVEIEIIS